MAIVTRHLCDRCKNDFSYRGKTSRTRRGIKKFKITYLWDGNPSGYDYSEAYVELCADCTQRLQAFLENKESENGKS